MDFILMNRNSICTFFSALILILGCACATSDEVVTDSATSPERELILESVFGENWSEEWGYNQLAARKYGVSLTEKEERLAKLKAAVNTWLYREKQVLKEPEEADLRALQEQFPSTVVTKDRLNLQSILIRKFASESDESLKQRVQEVSDFFENDGEFHEAALLFSDASSRALGGSAGTIERGELPPDLEELVFSLEENEVHGPFERDNGTYFFRTSGRINQFDFSNQQSVKEYTERWKTIQLGIRFNTVKEEYLVNHTIERKEPPPSPDSIESLRGVPWITNQDEMLFDYYDLFLIVTHSDINASLEDDWDTFWADESLLQFDYVRSGLAAQNALATEGVSWKTAEEIESVIWKGRKGLRKAYQHLEPTDQELDVFFEREDIQAKLRRTYFTGLRWVYPMFDEESEKTYNPRERAGIIRTTLDLVYQKINASLKADSPSDVFEDLLLEFPNSRIIAFQETDSIGPFVDAALFRTAAGELSRPYDHDSQVEVIFMESRGERVPEKDAIESQLSYLWRQDQYLKLIEELRSESQID